LKQSRREDNISSTLFPTNPASEEAHLIAHGICDEVVRISLVFSFLGIGRGENIQPFFRALATTLGVIPATSRNPTQSPISSSETSFPPTLIISQSTQLLLNGILRISFFPF
jgi:hypothetical protein